MYFTEAELRAYADPSLKSLASRRIAKSLGAQGVEATVFLSHSHEDAHLVEAIESFLANQGVYVYVDWKDKTMPATTTALTGIALKERIFRCRKFVVLASNRAIDSRWVPWELGYADGIKTGDHIAVLPAGDRSRQWIGAEYLGSYPTIELSDDRKVGVFPAGSSNGCSLVEWLKR
jgi:hypothetical protein